MLFSKKEKERKEPVVEESSLPSELEDITAMESARRAQEERAYRPVSYTHLTLPTNSRV